MNAKQIGVAAAVFAALLVLLAMALAGKHSAAEDAAALRHLQMWGIALNLYLIDHDNELPDVGESFGEDGRTWFNALPPYLSKPPLAEARREGKNPRPGEPSLWSSPRTKPPRVWDASQIYSTYAMNRALQPDPELRPFKIQELEVPGNVIFLGEGDGYNPGLTPENLGRAPGLPASHKLAYILFCDGHAQALPAAEVAGDPAARKTENLKNGGISWFLE